LKNKKHPKGKKSQTERSNTMQPTVQAKLCPTKIEYHLIKNTMQTYIATVNDIVSAFVEIRKTDKRTSKDINSNMPSALINQSITDAKSIYKKYSKAINKQNTGIRKMRIKNLRLQHYPNCEN
jgi:hypothetical protein